MPRKIGPTFLVPCRIILCSHGSKRQQPSLSFQCWCVEWHLDCHFANLHSMCPCPVCVCVCVCVCVYLYANGFPFPSGIQYPVRVCKKRLNTNSRDQHWLASWQAGNKRINHRIGDEEIRQRQHELNKTEYMRGNETERRLAPQLVTCHYIDIIVKVTYGGGNISCSSQ